jgi:hypothetical protein
MLDFCLWMKTVHLRIFLSRYRFTKVVNFRQDRTFQLTHSRTLCHDLFRFISRFQGNVGMAGCMAQALHELLLQL